MNKQRRKSLTALIDQFESLKCELETLMEEEEEYRDNMPENLQGSERYDMADEAVSNLEDAISSLEDVTSSIEAAIE